VGRREWQSKPKVKLRTLQKTKSAAPEKDKPCRR
jgi:hypothetical protein